MGRYYTGDIEGKFWFGIQSSNAADRFGVMGYEPDYIVYNFQEEDLEGVEQEIKNIEETLGNKVEIIENTRAIIYPFELDIVIPEKNYAIEYCGLYWHSEANGKDKNYHLNKLRKCENNNYHLITIFEDEWLHNKELVKKRLLVKLGISNSQKVYARNCLIREIDNKTKKDFLIRNHMQGDDTSSIKLGAYHDDSLVAVMTFRTSFREKENKPYELSRFCSDYDYSVVGIAGRLFKHFVKKYSPEQVITFGDRRWNTGLVYEKLGFKFKYNTPPNYWYVVGDRRYHRFNFRKNNIKYFENYSPDKTEQEITEAEGYHRLYDCGNSKWIWSLNN